MSFRAHVLFVFPAHDVHYCCLFSYYIVLPPNPLCQPTSPPTVVEETASCPMPMAGTACLLTMHYLQTSEVKGGSWCSGEGLSMRANQCGERDVVTCFDEAGDELYHLSCEESAPELPDGW